MGFLEKNFPDLFVKYQKLYSGAYAPKSYAKEVQAIVKLLQERHGLHRRGKTERPDDEDEDDSSSDESESFEKKSIGPGHHIQPAKRPCSCSVSSGRGTDVCGSRLTKIHERRNPLLGRRMSAEHAHQSTGRKRLDDEHVRRRRVGVHRDLFRRAFELAQRIR